MKDIEIMRDLKTVFPDAAIVKMDGENKGEYYWNVIMDDGFEETSYSYHLFEGRLVHFATVTVEL